MGLLALIACPAEQLGVELPRGGAAAISVEDLRHDVPILAEGGEKVFLSRMAEMHFLPSPAENSLVCVDRGVGVVHAYVATWPSSPDTATAAAALVSIARAWDLDGGPPFHAELCIAPVEYLGLVHVGALANGPLVVTGGTFASGRPRAEITPDQVDYDALAHQTKTIFTAFEANSLP